MYQTDECKIKAKHSLWFIVFSTKWNRPDFCMTVYSREMKRRFSHLRVCCAMFYLFFIFRDKYLLLFLCISYSRLKNNPNTPIQQQLVCLYTGDDDLWGMTHHDNILRNLWRQSCHCAAETVNHCWCFTQLSWAMPKLRPLSSSGIYGRHTCGRLHTHIHKDKSLKQSKACYLDPAYFSKIKLLLSQRRDSSALPCPRLSKEECGSKESWGRDKKKVGGEKMGKKLSKWQHEYIYSRLKRRMYFIVKINK